MTNIRSVFFIVLTVLSFTNCSTKTPQTNIDSAVSFFADTAKNNKTDSLHLTFANIMGDWTNCATKSGGITTMANVCRTIKFKSDMTAIITYPSQERQVVRWTISNDLLVVTLSGEKNDPTNRMLTDSVYETRLSKDAEGFNLELKAKNADLTYYLGRQF